VLIPVGAALTARDNVVEVTRTFSTPSSAQRQLRKFERRGITARNRLEREVRRARTRIERQLRQRRNQATRLVRRNQRSFQREVKSVQRDFGRRVDGLQTDAEGIRDRVQDQVTSLA
jgi:hypothetical protein